MVPTPVLRKRHRRILHMSFRSCFRLRTWVSTSFPTDCLIVPLALLIGTIASLTIIVIHTPFPKYSEMEPRETADPEHSSVMDIFAAMSQKIKRFCGIHRIQHSRPRGDYVGHHWITQVPRSKGVLLPHKFDRNYCVCRNAPEERPFGMRCSQRMVDLIEAANHIGRRGFNHV